MLWRLRRLWERWRTNGRGVFRYWNGRTVVWGDPVRLWRALLRHPDLADLEAAFASALDGKSAEGETVVAAIRDVFGCEAFDPITGRGLTEMELVGLAVAFGDYLEALKKNGSPGPSGPPSGDSTPSPPEAAPG